MPLTTNETRLIEQLFAKFDRDNKGFIDEKDAKGSSKMLRLIKGMRIQATGSPEGKLYLSDLIDHYKVFKKERVDGGRSSEEEIVTVFVKNMTQRVEAFQRRPSYAADDFESFEENEDST